MPISTQLRKRIEIGKETKGEKLINKIQKKEVEILCQISRNKFYFGLIQKMSKVHVQWCVCLVVLLVVLLAARQW